MRKLKNFIWTRLKWLGNIRVTSGLQLRSSQM